MKDNISSMLNEARREHLDKIIKRYPKKQAALLPALYLVQDQAGYISKEAMQYIADYLEIPYGHVLGVVTFYTMFYDKPIGRMQYIADYLEIPYGHVLGVVTFYTMFYDKPVGRHHIQVCTNVSCQLLGSEPLVSHIGKQCGVEPGETSEDGRFTLSEVECLGSCGTAPMMQVNDDYHENLTVEKVDALLESMK